MDPNQTLCDLLSALQGHNAEEAMTSAADLIRWLAKGGFPPNVHRGTSTYEEDMRGARTRTYTVVLS